LGDVLIKLGTPSFPTLPNNHLKHHKHHNMAEAVGLAASIISILQLSASIIKFIGETKGSSDNRNRLLTEIASTQGFLYALKDKAESPQCDDKIFQTMRALNQPNGPLEQFKQALERLASKLKPAENMKKIGKALIWPFQKAEIKEVILTIERQKSLFNLALQNDHM
jgi:hypothetical protein